MIAITIVAVCEIFSICFCLVGIGLSLDRIGNALECIVQNMKKGGE